MRKLGLLVGVGRYGVDFGDLSAPPNDVAAFENVLRADGLGGFDQLDCLGGASDGVVTREQFLAAFEVAADSVERNDM
ncbi:hypothetical protein, partial [Streptomyces sp. NPDC002520]